MGSGVNDYFQACLYGNPSLTFGSSAEEKAFREKYGAVEQITAERLLTSPPSLFFLHEVNIEDRPLINALRKKNFQIYHMNGEHFDTAVALSEERYAVIKNVSLEIAGTDGWKKDVAIVKATDRITGRRMAFVSTHTPGFSFDEMHDAKTKESKAQLAREGDHFSSQLIVTLSTMEDVDSIVIGSDMNAHPEVWRHRFRLFSKAGYRILRTRSPTNVNRRGASEQLRELDFIFVKEIPSRKRGTLRERITSLFKNSYHLESAMQPSIRPLHSAQGKNPFNPEINASDHLPVFASLTSYQKGPLDRYGSIPLLSTLIGCGRITVALIASLVYTIAWGVLALLSKETTPTKQRLSRSLQHLTMGTLELIPGLKWGLEKLLLRFRATITLRETVSPVDAAPLGNRKTLGQFFWTLIHRPSSPAGEHAPVTP